MSIKRVRVRRERKIKEREEERIKEQLAIFKSVKKDGRYNWQKLELKYQVLMPLSPLFFSK